MNNFNILPNRRDSESEKWNHYPTDTIPLWVADSDFAIPSDIINALKSRLEHPVLGYGQESTRLRELVVARMKNLYNWNIEANWICFTPGVVSSLNSCRAIMGRIGSNAVTAIPVYPHLRNSTPALEREMKYFNMINVGTGESKRYTPDFKELVRVIDDKTKMLMLCNPHNPVGTIYNDTELHHFADIAEKHDLLICSDDIHADFVLYDDKPYRPIASLSPEISNRTITLMAASKTFNIAGLNCSYVIIENASLREKFTTQLKGLVGGVNILGFIASEAAYEYGDEWLKVQMIHLLNNAEYCYERINATPTLSMNKMESTYLAWIDVTELNEKVRTKGFNNTFDYLLSYHVAVSDGKHFGNKDFIRLNLATTKPLLTEALNRIQQAIKEL
ncbi:MAG: MalY/PatB family protein [Ostreibacterium sp.]